MSSTIDLIKASGWKPPLISKKGMLKLPELDVLVEVKDDDVAAFENLLTDYKKKYEAFKKTLNAEFDKRFAIFSNTRFADIQAAIDDLESRLASKTKEEAGALVDGANSMLTKACLTWKGQVESLGNEALDVALKAFLSAANRPIIKAKAKCIAKIIVRTAFALVEGAMEVAKKIADKDAKGAMKALFTQVLVPFVKVAYDEYHKSWPTVNNVSKQVEKHIAELQKAMDELAEHDKKYKKGEEVSNLDALFNEAKLAANNLTEQMAVLDGHVVHYVRKAAAQKKEIEELEQDVADPQVTAKLQACRDKLERAGALLEKISAQKKAIAEIQKQLTARKRPANTGSALKSLIKAIAEGRKGMEMLSTALDGIKSVAAAVKS